MKSNSSLYKNFIRSPFQKKKKKTQNILVQKCNLVDQTIFEILAHYIPLKTWILNMYVVELWSLFLVKVWIHETDYL